MLRSCVFVAVTFVAVSSRAQIAAPPVHIIAKHSSKCLAVERASNRDGTRIVQMTCDASKPEQLWRLQPGRSGSIQIVTGSGLCLSVDDASMAEGANLVQAACNGSSNQLWSMRPSARGSELIATHSRRCLNVAGADAEDGARIVQSECLEPARPHQLFDTRAPGSENHSSSGIAGSWRWSNGATMQFRDDGSVLGSNGSKGRWNRDDGRRYVITWDEGWVDRVVVADDGQKLRGSNQSGGQVSAERIGQAPETDKPQLSTVLHRPPGPSARDDEPVGMGAQVSHAIKDAQADDCGAGRNDPGCDMTRGNDHPMTAQAFDRMMETLRGQSNELTKREQADQLVGSRLLTAMQFGVILSQFRNELNMLDVTRGIAKNVVNPDALRVHASKFRNNNNKRSYESIVNGLTDDKPKQKPPLLRLPGR